MMQATAVFCGDGTLLIRCAELFRQAGGTIEGVITADAQIAAWAEAEGLARMGTPEAPDPVPEVDHLFSVANLAVLPDSLLARARRMAINFHDGPLPGRAGLNVPAWAILEGAGRHAVTWHQMAGKVDAGGILATRDFEIRPADTAFSLNARCYEAGLEAFRALLADLEAGSAVPRPQAGERGWYARARRPDRLGTLDPRAPAGDLARTVRALDFGGYLNPLAQPKLWTGAALLSVGRAELLEDTAGGPGQVLAADADGITLRAGDRALRLGVLSDMAGAPVDPTALAGQVLPVPDFPDAPAPQAVGRAEPAWIAALSAATGAALPPFPLAHGQDDGTPESAAFDAAGAGATTLAAAWMAWIAGMTGQAPVCLALRGADPGAPWLSALRPVTLDAAAHAGPAALEAALAEAREAALARAPMAADLPLRLAHPETRRVALQALSVVLAEGGEDAAALGTGAMAIVAGDRPRLLARPGLFEAGALDAIARDFAAFLAAFRAAPGASLADLPLGASAPLARSGDPFRADVTIAAAIAAAARAAPGAPALEAGSVRLSFAELDARVAALAGALAARGAGPGTVVGLCVERSADLVTGMLAILRTGAAYLPLDPDYPHDRIALMLEDSGAPLVLAGRGPAARLGLDPARLVFPDAEATPLTDPRGGPEDMAYLIYTSGSTGRPKGVMVTHRNVMNFFAGMDEAVPLSPGARLLSVTSVSFDISVLEILWTLARGATLVLQTEAEAGDIPDFSLFYFASEAAGTGHHAYRLLLEGAKFADANGFSAIWTPERHFHAFGGLYPNPAITAAALAGITKNLKLRAGSSVIPLHHPVRVAEDWALVDNLSNGRAGIALASGWQPNDFLLRPDSFAGRKQVMLDAVDTIRALWRGERRSFPGHDGKPVEVEIHPRPMQAEVPLWLTAAGNPETFAAAARLGCGVLTHLLGQTFEEVAEKIRAYRVAWREHGHPGDGHVVLMLHTFIGEDEAEVMETARGPMKAYLKSAVDLVRRAAWTFPTIVARADASGRSPAEIMEAEELSAADLDALLEHAFERYYGSAGLFGTPESAAGIVRQVAGIGVDEIGCLVDFGIDTDVALAALPRIKALMDGVRAQGGVTRKASVAEEIVARNVTHLQCTPSMAAMLAADEAGRTALGRLDCLMVGGEALPPDLARTLREAVPGVFLNMYGPTETTIWSAVARLDAVGARVPLGAPVANTTLAVCAPDGRDLPDLAEGELRIGGEGVARGYWNRPDLTAERFVETPRGRIYRTGDLVRRRPGGVLEFLGRMDGQVKIRGHRIELGEIEAALSDQPGVGRAAVRAMELSPGDMRIVGWVTPARAGTAPDPETLRAGLAGILPEIMLPARIVVLDRMPMTPNGKIDRKALPAPFGGAAEAPAIRAEGETEALIAGIWSEALGVPEVSVTANFFDLGGHSLLVVQVQRQMKEALGRDIAITDLFRFPTVRSLAAHLSAAGGSQDAPSAASRGAARAAARLARMGRR